MEDIMKTNKKLNKGFTLIEMVIVIAVVAILAAILIPTFTHVINDANEAKVQAQLNNVYTEYVTENIDTVIDGDKLVFVYEGRYFRLDANSDAKYVEVSDAVKNAVTGNAAYESASVQVFDWTADVHACLIAYDAYVAAMEADGKTAKVAEDITYEFDGKYYSYASGAYTEFTGTALDNVKAAVAQQHDFYECKAQNVVLHMI